MALVVWVVFWKPDDFRRPWSWRHWSRDLTPTAGTLAAQQIRNSQSEKYKLTHWNKYRGWQGWVGEKKLQTEALAKEIWVETRLKSLPRQDSKRLKSAIELPQSSELRTGWARNPVEKFGEIWKIVSCFRFALDRSEITGRAPMG